MSFWSTSAAVVCMCFTPPELWQRARRMALTPTFPSFFYLTRRPPPRGELPPRRETSTQNSTRGKTRKRLKQQKRSEDVDWLTLSPCLHLSTGLILISLWRSPTREDWTCLWRTASPSWAERGSLLARCVSPGINQFIHIKLPEGYINVLFVTRQLQLDLEEIDLKACVTQW